MPEWWQEVLPSLWFSLMIDTTKPIKFEERNKKYFLPPCWHLALKEKENNWPRNIATTDELQSTTSVSHPAKNVIRFGRDISAQPYILWIQHSGLKFPEIKVLPCRKTTDSNPIKQMSNYCNGSCGKALGPLLSAWHNRFIWRMWFHLLQYAGCCNEPMGSFLGQPQVMCSNVSTFLPLEVHAISLNV